MDKSYRFAPHQQFGQYSLIKYLGEGAFGEVWLAENAGKYFAIKFPFKDQADWKKILQEIGVWVICGEHKNVLRLITAKNLKGQIGIISEYAPDGSLGDLLNGKGLLADTLKKQGKLTVVQKRINKEGKEIEKCKLSIEESVRMTIEILEGLQQIHENGVIHRDLKPENILLQGNIPRLADFGISRILESDKSRTQPVGTRAYMSPESLDGIRNERTDIWSVSVILYQLLIGSLPFDGINAICRKEPLPIKIAPELKDIIWRGLEKDPKKRYKNAEEMRKDLERFCWVNPVRNGHFAETETPLSEVSTTSLESEFPLTESSPIVFEDNVSVAESLKEKIDVKAQPSPQPNTKHINQDILNEDSINKKDINPTVEEKDSQIKIDEPDLQVQQSQIPTLNLLEHPIKSLSADIQNDAVTEAFTDEIDNKKAQIQPKTIVDSIDEKKSSESTVTNKTEGKKRNKRNELFERLRIANERAKKLGIYTLNVESSLAEKSVEEFEVAVKYFEGRISEAEEKKQKELQAKATKLLQRVRDIEKKAIKFGIPLPDKLNLTENVVLDFEKQVAEVEQKELKNRINSEKKNTDKSTDNNPLTFQEVKTFLRTPFFTLLFLSGIALMFWIFPSMLLLLPKGGGLLFLIFIVIAATIEIVKEGKVPLVFSFIFGFLLLFGVNYLIDSTQTKAVIYSIYSKVGETVGFKEKNNAASIPANKVFTPNLLVNTNNNSVTNAPLNSNINNSVNISTNNNSNSQSNIQIGNFNSLGIFNKPLHERIRQIQLNNDVKKKIEKELKKRGFIISDDSSLIFRITVDVYNETIILKGLVWSSEKKREVIGIANKKSEGREIDSSKLTSVQLQPLIPSKTPIDN